MNDLVSIIMPSYNTAAFIADSINSVLAQTYDNWELIIVDDCSTDESVSVINSFSDERIILIKNEKNSGAAVSRNTALKTARGKWIAFLDSDDIWLPEKLEKQIHFMEENGYKMSYTDYRICCDGIWENVKRTAPDKVTLNMLYCYCWFSTITVIYEREAVGLVQIADVRKNNDYAMWFKVLEKVDGYRLPCCLSYYIKHGNSISAGSKLKLIKYFFIMYRVALNKCVLTSAFLTVLNLFFGVIKKIFYKEKPDATALESEKTI